MAKKRTAVNEETVSSASKRRRTSESEDAAVTPKVTRQSKRISKDSITLEAPSTQDILSKPTASEPTVRQSKHVRFDDEEDGGDENAPLATAENDEEPIEEKEAAAEEDSDDDAPDAISTTVAQKDTKASLASVAKAVSRQRTDEKRKRKDRDARLKSQADAAKRAKPGKAMEAEDQEEVLGADSDTALPVSSERDTIGGMVETESSLDLLPAHLLQEDFTRQPSPSSPPQSGSKDHQNSREVVASQRKLFIRDLSSLPREKQVGPVNVAVLEKSNAFLAPKADGKGKRLREGWLKGRLGRGGKVLIERGAVNRGFARH